MKLIDTHSHLTFEEFLPQLDGVLDRSREKGICTWITVGTDMLENANVVQMVSMIDGVYGTVGFHPHCAKEVNSAMLKVMRAQASNERIVAIGEMGLDYHYDFSPRNIQQHIFRTQLDIAVEKQMPVVVHSREAFDDTVEILSGYVDKLPAVIIHCFGYGAEEAKIFVDMGFYVSFTGVVTFKNADSTREAALEVPMDRILVETDCPYMSPAPLRKERVCEPSFMIHTASKLAEVKGVSLEEFAKVTTETACKIFGLKI